MIIGLFSFHISSEKKDLPFADFNEISSTIKLERLFSSSLGCLSYNPFNTKDITFGHSLIRKSEDSLIIGFCSDDDGDQILTLMESICNVSNNCSFTSYYFWDNDISNKLVQYEACNGERIKWFDVNLSSLNQGSIENLRANRDYKNLISVFDLFNEYHIYLNQTNEDIIGQSQFLKNSIIDYVVDPFEKYEDKISDQEYSNNAGEDDLPF
jgi:hypothetical protein